MKIWYFTKNWKIRFNWKGSVAEFPLLFSYSSMRWFNSRSVQKLEEVVPWRICIPSRFWSTRISLFDINDHMKSICMNPAFGTLSNCSKSRFWLSLNKWKWIKNEISYNLSITWSWTLRIRLLVHLHLFVLDQKRNSNKLK